MNAATTPPILCFDTDMSNNPWDAQTYDARFGFVTAYGADQIDVLDPQPDETILDLGCGTGHHAAQIAARGAHVVGMDLDETMLAKARQDHPEVEFRAADATAFDLAALEVEQPFDACFSNAALHWMVPQAVVLANVRGVLLDGARFVAEMGGAGNIATLDLSLRTGLGELGLSEVDVPTNHFPTLGEQATALEGAGFRVDRAHWFARPTPLGADVTAADWTKHFRAATWGVVPAERHDELSDVIDTVAAERGLLTDDGWVADYCRLRFVATAV